jgi:hypothetical protein
LRNKKILEDWVNDNSDTNASELQKLELSEKTNLTIKQISYWLNNNRRKNKSINKNTNRLTTNAKIILNDYFNNINKRPSARELIDINTLTLTLKPLNPNP